MAYDADLVLRGQYDSAYVDLVTGDTAASTETVEATGNVVVDLGVGGADARGLDCIVIFHDVLTTYQQTCDIVIQDSDHVAAGFADLLSFPRVYCYMREVIVRATTAFTTACLGVDLTEAGLSYDGHVRAFSRELLAIGGIGKIWVEMQDADDTYVTSGDILTSDGTGVGTQIGAGRVIQTGLTIVRRFSTPKRYIRCSNTVSATGDYGDVDILVTGSQHSHKDNLYRSHV